MMIAVIAVLSWPPVRVGGWHTRCALDLFVGRAPVMVSFELGAEKQVSA